MTNNVAERKSVRRKKTQRQPTTTRGRQPTTKPTRTRAAAGSKNLVIVESPAKARTIGPILGSTYVVEASLGHVRDLPKSSLGVSVDDDFTPKYLIPREKRVVVNRLKELAKNAKMVYLATDPDREGEAIAWHLVQAADIEDKPLQRVVFHEITPEAIREAFAHPKEIDMNLVYAQQARRVLDRLVGYTLSPVLWRKVRSGLSAGRVQSVALRMIVDREREIQHFTPQEHWSIDAELAKSRDGARARRGSKGETFTATLVSLAGKRGRSAIPDQVAAQALVSELRPATYQVASIAKKQSQRQPPPPFTTSTLQQEAARKLGFTAQRTMAVAQQLYEGLAIGQGAPVGLITYLRTDSVRVAESAVGQARQYIQQAFGGDFVPRTPRHFTQRSKGAQEAHEAIRPTLIAREPDSLRNALTSDQRRLYELVWKRMVASQMAAANLETITAEVEARNATTGKTYTLRSADTRVLFPGYQALYQESRDDDEQDSDSPRRPRQNAGQILSALIKDDALDLQNLDPLQHFTQPPPRYTEASLVKALEANGIGRPSTYATILSTLQGRDYVRREQRQLVPQELGMVVNDLLTEHFPEVVDIGFTARLEDDLDDIAAGGQPWVPVVREFYQPFSKSVEEAYEAIKKIQLTPEFTGEDCVLCGRPMIYRVGRYGRFQACSGFPDCRNTKPILKTIGVSCPKDGGLLVEKRGRQTRRVFYGCANFPACDFTSWDKPLSLPCPECKGLLVEPRRGHAKCTQCSYTGPVPRQAAGDAPRELVGVTRS